MTNYIQSNAKHFNFLRLPLVEINGKEVVGVVDIIKPFDVLVKKTIDVATLEKCFSAEVPVLHVHCTDKIESFALDKLGQTLATTFYNMKKSDSNYKLWSNYFA